ncbi:MAG: hypothetical protein LBK74_02870 [Treponema sp.]|jgi:hypothetical protein|nr:hypothetical protein [Treponema sp.]
MRKRKSTKSRATDFLIILFCLAGASVSGMLFWQEYNRTLVKLNEAPVGTIVFKNRTAHRKIENRIAWDRLKQTSPVYNGDTIRTAELSEAVITFPNAVANIGVFENTLIQIFYSEAEGARIDLTSGNLDVTAGSGSVFVSSGASTIEIGQGSQVSLNQSSEGLGLAVSEGTARVNGTDLESGGVLSFLADGSPNSNPAIAMTAPGGFTRVLGSPEGRSAVLFSWNTANFNSDTRVLVEAAQDKGFTRIVESRDVQGASSATLSFPPGMYFWRAVPVQGSGPVSGSHPSGRIEVLPPVSLTVFTPAQGKVFTFSGDSRVSFSWSAVEGAAGYLLEISANENMSAPEVSRRIQGTSVVQTGLEEGRWYWRVEPLFPDQIQGAAVSSGARDFSVVRGSIVPAIPVLTFPAESDYINSENPNLLWRYDPGVESWTVEVADNPQMFNPLVQQSTNVNFYSLASGEALQIGTTYYWRVTAQGGVAASSAVQSFIPEDPAVLAARSIRRPPVPVPAVPEPVSEPVVAGLAAAEVVPAEPVIAEPVEPPVPEPPLVVEPEPAALAVVEPEPPVIAEPAPEPPPLPVQEPPPAPGPVRSETREEILRRLTAVSGGGTITATFPMEGYAVSLEQLAKAPSLVFNWEGQAREYYFSLYRTNGEAIIVMTSINEPRYRFQYPTILEAGDYVWQVFERDSQGIWPDAPSVARRFTVTSGPASNAPTVPAIIKQLPTSEPGVLYGNP